MAEKASWIDKAWPIVTLVIGFLLGLVADRVKLYLERREEEARVVTILKAEVEHQTANLKTFVAGLENLKAGKFPDLASSAATVDEALKKGRKQISATFLSHKSTIIESVLLKAHFLPKNILDDLIRTYENLNNCESHRIQCEQNIKTLTTAAEKPMPACDTYLDVMKSTIETTQRLLEGLKKLP